MNQHPNPSYPTSLCPSRWVRSAAVAVLWVSTSLSPILAQVTALPTTKAPLTYWFPEQAQPKVGFPLKDCFDPESNFHASRLDVQGTLPHHCQPDTLYSWGSEHKLERYKAVISTQTTWPQTMHPLYLSRSAIATFGYGPVALRIKLKKNIKFKPVLGFMDCTATTAAESAQTVYFRVGPWADFTLCSPQVIESWSHSTREHYDEIIKEHAWITTPGRDPMEYDLYNHMYEKMLGSDLFNFDYEGKDFSFARFLTTLGAWIERIGTKREEIFYNPSNADFDATTKTQDELRHRHFSTDKPIFYNDE